MSNLIVVSFTNETQAIEGSHKLIELESFGDVTVYEKVIIKKDANGETTVLQSETSDGLRTLSGMTLGTLAGAFAGPVGLLVGMISGTLVGAVLESNYFDFSDDVTSKVKNRIQPGTVALIAEIDEDNAAIVDSALAPFGATIFRSDVDYVYDKFVDDQVEEIDEEIAAERAKIKSSAAAEKSKIQEKIAQLKEKRRQRIATLKGKQKSVIAKVKASMAKEKEARLRYRISKHLERIGVLEEKLSKIEH